MCMCWECSTSVGEWKLIEYKTCTVSYGKMVKIKMRLGCGGPCASVKGNLVEVLKCE